MSPLDLDTQARIRDQSTWFEIDQSALRHNLSRIRQMTSQAASILAVVKANAYGHGLLEIGQCLRGEVSYFGVSTIEEALQLRDLGTDIPVLLFGVPSPDLAEAAIQADIALTISSVEQARQISRAAEKLNKSAVVHVKVDTGMGRLGIRAGSAVAAIETLSCLENLQLEGLFTHFAQGEDARDPFTWSQIASFCRVIEAAAKKGIEFAYRHAANSVGIVNYQESHFNLVRPGISLYGLCPNLSLAPKLNLKPVLRWRAKLILVKKLMPGESTGYSRSFVADQETVIGILPVGYSHGYPYALSNKSEVLYGGRRYPVVGRVSMDYTAINFGNSFDGKAGAVVTLIGRDGDQEVTGEDLAGLAGTIPYEIVTRLSASIPRLIV